MPGSHIASVPILLVLAACVHGGSESRTAPAAQPATVPPTVVSEPAPREAPGAAPPAAVPTPPAQSPPPDPNPPSARTAPRTAATAPAARASAPYAKAPTGAAAAPAVSSPPSAPPASALPARTATAPAPALDLNGLEQRLRDTHAIGVFTKLTLKNQVGDLLAQFKSFHKGQSPPTLPQLRQQYEVLLLKVITLLQNDDPALANAVSSSRDAIWGVLVDPKQFANI